MRGNPKIDASNQTARVCIANSARFFILAIFGFPLNTPLPTRHAHSPFATAQGAPCQKRGFGAARYRVAREARFRATFSVPHHLWGAAFIHTTLCGQFLLSMFALSCDRARGAMPKARSFGYCFSSRATFSVPHHLWGAAFIHTTLCGQFLLSMFALSCDRARGALPKARSFGDCIIYRATVVVVLSAMSKFFLDFLCGCAPSLLLSPCEFFLCRSFECVE